MPILQIPTEYTTATREQLYTDFQAKLTELKDPESGLSDGERELLALVEGLFLFSFWPQ